MLRNNLRRFQPLILMHRRSFSTHKKSPLFIEVANTYQKIEEEPGRNKKQEHFMDHLLSLDNNIDHIKDFYRLSTGLLQPKSLNNMQSEMSRELQEGYHSESAKSNSVKFQKMQ